MTSREQRLITKEHIATHTNLFLWFNPLNTQVHTLVIKLLNGNIKLHYARIPTVTLQASLSL